MEDRIIELEKRVAFQENTIEELNDVILAQQKKIDELSQKIDQLHEKLSSDDIVRKIEDEEPPPHY